MKVEDRLTYVDLSNLYNNTPSTTEAPVTEPGQLAVDLLKLYEFEPILALSVSPDIPDYIIHVNNDADELVNRINELLSNKDLDLLEVVKRILEENKDLLAVVVYDGYDTGVAFSKILGRGEENE